MLDVHWLPVEAVSPKSMIQKRRYPIGLPQGGLASGHGLSGKQALEIYTERGERIFPEKGRVGGIRRSLRRLMKPKHDQEALKANCLRCSGTK